jgi:hypothetical protein
MIAAPDLGRDPRTLADLVELAGTLTAHQPRSGVGPRNPRHSS